MVKPVRHVPMIGLPGGRLPAPTEMPSPAARWNGIPWLREYVTLQVIHRQCGKMVSVRWLRQQCDEMDIILRCHGKGRNAVTQRDAYRLLDRVLEAAERRELDSVGAVQSANNRVKRMGMTGRPLLNSLRRAMAISALTRRLRRGRFLSFCLKVAAENIALRRALGDGFREQEFSRKDAERRVRCDLMAMSPAAQRLYEKRRDDAINQMVLTGGVTVSEVWDHYENLLAGADVSLLAAAVDTGDANWIV